MVASSLSFLMFLFYFIILFYFVLFYFILILIDRWGRAESKRDRGSKVGSVQPAESPIWGSNSGTVRS